MFQREPQVKARVTVERETLAGRRERTMALEIMGQVVSSSCPSRKSYPRVAMMQSG